MATEAQRQTGMELALQAKLQGAGSVPETGGVTPTAFIKALIEDADKIADFIADGTVPNS